MRQAATRSLERPWVYRLWMAPFADQKLRPLRARGVLERARRVLDVGCGPGTNTPLFEAADYLGIDINPAYVESARRRFGRTFVAGDVTDPTVLVDERFDFILVNSLLHHLDDQAVTDLLARLRQLLSPDGRIHILELVRPDHPSVARLLAYYDRGKYARPVEHWRALVGTAFTPVVTETYAVGLPGLTLWNMVYVMGQPA